MKITKKPEELSAGRERKETKWEENFKKGVDIKREKAKKSSKNGLILDQPVAFGGISKTVAKSC